MENDKEICFVIMPFGGHFDEYYENIYKPAIEESNLDPFRADNIYKPSTIIKDIWSLIQSSSIILADLTKKNANVFYELGLSHASKKPVIFIAESMDDVPFDLRAQRVITYNKDNYNWGENLKSKIIKSINETLKSPLKSVLPVFLEVEKNEKIPHKTKEFLELRNEIDLLKLKFNSQYGNKEVINKNLKIELNVYDIELLTLMADGYTMSEISEKMKLKNIVPSSVSSIEKRMNRLKDLFKAQNSIHLISIVRKLGII
ncbi:MAG: response regulator transcription factor [Flavobacteriaceae bacterium]